MVEKTVEIEFVDGKTIPVTVRRISSREASPVKRIIAPKDIQDGKPMSASWENLEIYKKKYILACVVSPEELKTLDGLETLLHDVSINRLFEAVQEVNGELGTERIEKKSEPPSSAA